MSQEKVTVLIILEGGVIQNIECGDFVEVTIRDYDCEDTAPDSLETDENGDYYIKSVW